MYMYTMIYIYNISLKQKRQNMHNIHLIIKSYV